MRFTKPTLPWLSAFALAAIVIAPGTASATLTLDIKDPLAGAGGSSGHLTAVFRQDGPNAVQVTITSFLETGQFLNGGGAQEALLFNYGPNVGGSDGARNLVFSDASIAGTHFTQGINVNEAGGGWFDWGIYFDSRELRGGESLTFKITKDTGPAILESLFNNPSAASGRNNETVSTGSFAVARVIRRVGGENQTTLFSSGPGTISSPEPTTIVMALTGLIPLGIVCLRRHLRRSADTAA